MPVRRQRTYLSQKTLLFIGLVLVSALLGASLLTTYGGVAFALVFGVVWLYLTFTRPMVGLIGYSIFILVRPHEIIGWSLPIPIEKIIAAPLIIGVALKLIRQYGPRIKFNAVDRSVVVFVMVALFSVFTSVWLGGAWERWMKIARLLIIFIFIAKIVDNPKHFKTFVIFVILTTIFHATGSIIQYYRGHAEFEMGIMRATGMDLSYGDPNSLAATIIYTLPLIYFYIKSSNRVSTRLFLMASSLVCIWCIVLTGSRTGMMAICFIALLVVLQQKNRVRNIVIGAVLLAMVFAVMPGQYRSRLYSTTDFSSRSGASQSAMGRVTGLVNGVRMMIDRPLLGVGVGQFALANGNIYGGGYMASHNLAGQVFGEMGMIGTIAFVMWLIALFKGLNRLQRRYDEDSDGSSSDRFMLNIVFALKMHIYCLLFMGIGGHNLYRYNWFIISGLVSAALFFAWDHVRFQGGEDDTSAGMLSAASTETEDESIRRQIPDHPRSD